MSHVACIETQITDLAALKAACEKLGYDFRENQKTHAWFGSWVDDSPVPREMFTDEEYAKIQAMSRDERRNYLTQRMGRCDHAIRVPGASYEVGVSKSPRGNGYRLHYDWWGGGGLVGPLGGRKAERLVQQYGVEKTVRQARKMGFAVRQQQPLPDGSVKITLLAN